MSTVPKSSDFSFGRRVGNFVSVRSLRPWRLAFQPFAGDVVYNGIHPYLGETDRQSRLEWISTLDKLEALNPIAVIAGHKIPENPDDPRIIGETRQYIRDFVALDEATTTARQLYDAMLELYPDRVNPGSLWSAASVAKK